MSTKTAKKIFKQGEVIMQQGQKGSCAYIIEDGLVEILIEKPDGRLQNVGTRGPGSLIGEMSIVDDAPRTATIKALKDCKMLEISQEDFTKRLKSTDPVIQTVTQVILTRYRDTLKRSEILQDAGTWPPVEELEKNLTDQTDIMESVKIGNEFKEAFGKDEVSLHYQPIVDLKTGHTKGFESLMRWHHKELGFISPGVFIPIAEKNGYIVEASKWALRSACLGLKAIEESYDFEEDLYVSVNFTSHDFAEADFVPNILSIIRDTGLSPHKIKLEITERLLIQQPDNAKAALEACRAEGIGIAIDDFGTGYSSLSYLYYFPIELLKIDQSFIKAMNKEDRSRELVKSIIGLGQNLGLDVIAEGVEEEEEGKILRDMGCDLAQGYYFARPQPQDVLIDIYKKNEVQKISA